MTGLLRLALFGFCAVAAFAGSLRDFIDPATGHRILRLSDEAGSTSLYFNYNAFTPGGGTLVFSTPTGIAAVNLETRALKKIVTGKVHLLFVGRKTGAINYDTGGKRGPKTIYQIAVTGGRAQAVAKITTGTIQTIDADETFLADVEEFANPGKIGRDGLMRDPAKPLTKGEMIKARLEAQIPMRIFTLSLKTGEIRAVIRSTDWLNHLQFSPADPGLLLYCHEGDWHRVDRLWMTRTDTSDARSVHFNSAPDGSVFTGDGGSPQMLAHAPDGQWLYIFRPHQIAAPDSGDHAAPGGDLIPPVFSKPKNWPICACMITGSSPMPLSLPTENGLCSGPIGMV